MSKEIRTIALGAVLVASLAVHAQTALTPAAAQPAAGAYNSAFEGYRPFAAGEVGDWRKANDTVRDIGGWRAYAREIQGGAQSSSQPAAAPARPANPHQGHTR